MRPVYTAASARRPGQGVRGQGRTGPHRVRALDPAPSAPALTPRRLSGPRAALPSQGFCLQGRGLERGVVAGVHPAASAQGLRSSGPRVRPRRVSTGLLAPPSGGRSRSHAGPREGAGRQAHSRGRGPRGARGPGCTAGVGAQGGRGAARCTAGSGPREGSPGRTVGVAPWQVHRPEQDCEGGGRGSQPGEVELHTPPLTLRGESLPQSLVTRWGNRGTKGTGMPQGHPDLWFKPKATDSGPHLCPSSPQKLWGPWSPQIVG